MPRPPDTAPATGVYLVVGPDAHGVVIHGMRLAQASPQLAAALVRVRLPGSGVTPPPLLPDVPAGTPVLLQVTDRLLGPTPEAAAEVVTELGSRTRLVLALHDVPQPSEGAAWYARRRAAYASFVEAAESVVVASEFERRLLEECCGATLSGVDVLVVPLPVERLEPPVAQPPTGLRSLAVLGFLYPGKGLEELIDLSAELGRTSGPVTVINLGGVAEGHESLVDELTDRARARGVGFEVTGYLPDADLPGALREAGVPVAPHRHISASGSINAWLAAGRRPVVRRGPYVEELAARLPGSVAVADELAAGIAQALEAPETTWLGPEVVLGPTDAEVAAAHANALAGAAALARRR